MNKLTKVAIGIPAYGPQPIGFSVSLADFVGRARGYGIEIVGPDGTMSPMVLETMATDRNRNGIARAFLDRSDAEWIYWWDTDNTNPANSLALYLRNAGTEKKIMCGVYVGKDDRNAPIAYYQDWDGRYVQLADWNQGEIMEIGMCGMNNVLVHREVFEAIDTNFVALQRVGVKGEGKDMVVHHGGGVVAIHKDDIIGEIEDTAISPNDGKVIDGVWHQRLIYPQAPTDVPFFALEFNKTEDAWFFELARRCGYTIYLDTAVVCGHIMTKTVNDDDYWRNLMMQWDGTKENYFKEKKVK